MSSNASHSPMTGRRAVVRVRHAQIAQAGLKCVACAISADRRTVGGGASGKKGNKKKGKKKGPPLYGQKHPMSCGIAAVRMVLASHGKFKTEESLRKQSSMFPGGFDPKVGTYASNLKDLLAANGLSAAQCLSNQSKENLVQAVDKSGATIALFSNPDGSGHFMVVDQVVRHPDGSRTFEVRDPWPPNVGTRHHYTEAEFDNRNFNGWMVSPQ